MKKLYFVRHGLTESNASGVFAGRTETPLTEEGRKQAKSAGKIVKDLQIDLVVCSPLSRALETAKIICEEIEYPVNKIHTSSLLVERSYGKLEGQPWSPDINLDGMSDVESNDELHERSKLALEWIESLGGSHILVVGHGSSGRSLRRHLKPEIPYMKRLQNAELHQWL